VPSGGICAIGLLDDMRATTALDDGAPGRIQTLSPGFAAATR
jgi:hypothetical protein